MNLLARRDDARERLIEVPALAEDNPTVCLARRSTKNEGGLLGWQDSIQKSTRHSGTSANAAGDGELGRVAESSRRPNVDRCVFPVY